MTWMKPSEKFPVNDINKKQRFDTIASQLADKLGLNDKKEDIRAILQRSDFKHIGEYCRAVHAEMEALMSVCRMDGHGTIDAKIYVTTQPCHNCTKHIIASGIREAIYIEPYPKSLAEDLHSDAIIFNPAADEELEDQPKVVFRQYEGVAPRRYSSFYSMDEDRKTDGGCLVTVSKEDSAKKPRFARNLNPRQRVGAARDPITLKEKEALVSFTKRISLSEKEG